MDRLGKIVAASSARLLADSRANVAITFALAATPLIFLVGAALDYSGASDLKVRLQNATDGAGLQLCQISGSPSQAQLEQAAQTYMASYMGTTPFTVDSVTPTTNPRQIQLSTRASFATSVVYAFNSNYRNLPVTASAKCFGEPQTFEVALVLDNTGSMATANNGQSKMDSLKSAATDFVNFIFSNAAMAPNTRISIVPFAAGVAVNPSTYRSASWVDTAGQASYHWNFVQGGKAAANAYGATSRFDAFNQLKASVSSWDWAGCFEALPYPLNTQDTAPTSSNPDSYYVPMFAPDESGAGGEIYHQDSSGNWVLSANSYMDDYNASGVCASTTDETARNGRPCKYLQIQTPRTSNGAIATGPNFSCTSRPLTRLTATKATLLSEINAMSPAGNTDIHEGFMWGWRSISPNSVFADGYSYTRPYNNKVIVLMTDGMNTWTSNAYNSVLKSYYSAYGHYRSATGVGPNNKLPGAYANLTTDTQARAAMDTLTLEACQNARNANVVIYTVGFSIPNDPIDQQGIDMLKSCAGATGKSFVANDSTALISIFTQIAQDIGNLKLTN